jgi:hypothetical protein
MRAKRAPRSPITFYSILKKFAKIALNHKIEEVVEIEVEHKIEEVVEIEVEHKIEEVVEIEVEHKIVEEVLGQFGGFWSTLRRFLQAGSTFVDFLAKSLSVDFCTPFLGSIFDPFSDFSLRAICLFYGTFSMSMVVFGPFLDVFWTVHFITILPTLGPPGARWLTGHCCRLASSRWLALVKLPFVD